MQLGSLNIFWLANGVLWAVFSVGSLDCSSTLKGMFGVEHTCTSLEAWINISWNVASAAWLVGGAALALLPARLAAEDYPAAANRAVLLTFSGVWAFFWVLNIIYPALTVPLEIDGKHIVVVNAVTCTISFVPLVILGLCIYFHKDPRTGEGMLYQAF